MRDVKKLWSIVKNSVFRKKSLYFEQTFGIHKDNIDLEDGEMYVRGAGNYYHKVHFDDIEEIEEADNYKKLEEFREKRKLEKLESFEEMKKRTKWLRQFDYVEMLKY